MLPHIAFGAGYFLYAFTYAKNGISAPYPVFLAPFVIYSLLCLCALAAAKTEKKPFFTKFKTASSALYVFLILLAAPLVLKVNFPDPHNFPLRKLELLLGASYAVFIFLLAGYFIYRVSKSFDVDKLPVKKAALSLFAFVFCFYFALSLWFNYANQPTGDEPEYLMKSHSMVKDGDLDLANNFAAADYSAFYTKELLPQAKEKNGRLYSFHPPLVSALSVPFYAAGGRPGVTLFMNMVSAVFAALVFYLLALIFRGNRPALQTSLLCIFSLPLLMFSNQICAEVLSGAILLGAFIMIVCRKGSVYAAAVLAALLPWSHPRNILLWLALGLIAAIEYRKELKSAVFFILAQAVSGALLILYNFHYYGSAMPGEYTDAKTLPGSGPAFGFKPEAIFGTFFDQEFGLFFYTPVFMLFIAGIYLLYKRSAKIFAYSLILLLPYLVMITSYSGWTGGGGASPRFLMPVIFLFWVFIAEVLIKAEKGAAWVVTRALSAAGILTGLIIAMVPWFRWNKGLGDNWILKFVSGFTGADLTFLFPSLWADPKNSWPAVIIWALMTAAFNIFILYYFFRAKR